jgi:hypothetical protein
VVAPGMFTLLSDSWNLSDNPAATKQKNTTKPQQAPGFVATEAILYLAATIILVAATTKIMHHQIIFMHKILKEQYRLHQKINTLAELQQDLLLPAQIKPTTNGIKIILKHNTPIDWQFKPHVQRGLNGSWTKLYLGQIEYELHKDKLSITFID